MERHVLTLRYDGLDASYYGGIGTSGSKQVVAGAQMLLGAHAHYYLSGAIPERINDNAPGFVVRDLGRKRGSLIAEFLVVLLGPAIWNAATYSYVAFVRDSYAAVKHGRLFDDPPFDHLQPSPIGETITAEAVLSKVEGRRLTFTVSASDSRGLVAAGKVLRVIVDVERFMGKCT